MKRIARLLLLVALSYLTARYAVHVLAAGIWRVDQELLAHMLIVPVSQVAILELLRLLRLRVL